MVYLNDISFPLLNIPGLSVAMFKNGDFTVVPFEASLNPELSLFLPNISFSLLVASNFLIPVEFTGGAWVEKTDGTGAIKPAELQFNGLGLKADLDGNFEMELSPSASIALDSIRLGNTDIVLEFSGITPYFSSKQSTPPYLPIGFKGVHIEEALMHFPAFWLHDQSNSSGVIKGRNLIIGSGGFSGSISMESIDPTDPNPPIIQTTVGNNGFNIRLTAFNLTRANACQTNSHFFLWHPEKPKPTTIN